MNVAIHGCSLLCISLSNKETDLMVLGLIRCVLQTTYGELSTCVLAISEIPLGSRFNDGGTAMYAVKLMLVLFESTIQSLCLLYERDALRASSE